MEVVILDGKDISSSEDMAMLQALYSRSPSSIHEKLKELETKDAVNFIDRYVISYGHKSVLDCGTTTIFIENVSMLAAKAIQDWPLYNGQESSTRYLNMNVQPILDYFGSPLSKALLDRWMGFYNRVLEEMVPYLREQTPNTEGVKESVFSKALKARAYDVARGYLPAGITTMVSWHTNLRQALDHLKDLRHHPLQEVREIAKKVSAELKQKYTSLVKEKEYETEEAWLAACSKQYYYDAPLPDTFSAKSYFEEYSIDQHQELLSKRPPKSEIPHRFRQYGEIVFSFALDFGSFRDLQRQRSCVLEMPLLRPMRFASWYLEQLPDSLRKDAEFLVAQQQASLHALSQDGCSPELLQYYCALGFEVPVLMTANLPSAVYIAELRSGETVHPTLRLPAQQMGKELKRIFPWMPVYIDESKVWTAKRGTQDIVRKDGA